MNERDCRAIHITVLGGVRYGKSSLIRTWAVGHGQTDYQLPPDVYFPEAIEGYNPIEYSFNTCPVYQRTDYYIPPSMLLKKGTDLVIICISLREARKQAVHTLELAKRNVAFHAPNAKVLWVGTHSDQPHESWTEENVREMIEFVEKVDGIVTESCDWHYVECSPKTGQNCDKVLHQAIARVFCPELKPEDLPPVRPLLPSMPSIIPFSIPYPPELHSFQLTMRPNLVKLFESSFLVDTTVKFSDGHVKAHKFVLACGSSTCKTLLTKNNNSDVELNFPDLNLEQGRLWIRSIYTNSHDAGLPPEYTSNSHTEFYNNLVELGLNQNLWFDAVCKTTDGETVPIIKAAFYSTCGFFESLMDTMLLADPTAPLTEIPLSVSSKELCILKDFVYGVPCSYDEQNVFDCLKVATKFIVPPFEEACVVYILFNLEKFDAVELLQFASRNSIKKISDYVSWMIKYDSKKYQDKILASNLDPETKSEFLDCWPGRAYKEALEQWTLNHKDLVSQWKKSDKKRKKESNKSNEEREGKEKCLLQ